MHFFDDDDNNAVFVTTFNTLETLEIFFCVDMVFLFDWLTKDFFSFIQNSFFGLIFSPEFFFSSKLYLSLSQQCFSLLEQCFSLFPNSVLLFHNSFFLLQNNVFIFFVHTTSKTRTYYNDSYIMIKNCVSCSYYP